MRCCFSSPHTYTHTQARRTRDWLCVFCTLHIYTDTHHAERTWQLATESELFSRLKTQHAALHLHCRNCTPLFLSFSTHMALVASKAHTARPRKIFQHAGIGEIMCRLIEADWFLHAENQNSYLRHTGCWNKEEYFRAIISLFAPSCCCQLTQRDAFCPGSYSCCGFAIIVPKRFLPVQVWTQENICSSILSAFCVFVPFPFII